MKLQFHSEKSGKITAVRFKFIDTIMAMVDQWPGSSDSHREQSHG
jgi:hypothetical protein